MWYAQQIISPAPGTVMYFLSCLIYITSWSNSLSISETTTYPTIGVIGGGPSGVFAAITAATKLQDTFRDTTTPPVTIYEASSELLQSFKTDFASNGLSDTSNIPLMEDTSKKTMELLMDGYPRGRNEIASIMTKSFPPIMQQKWFEEKGIDFQTKRDAGVVAFDAETVFAALEEHEMMKHISIRKGAKVVKIQKRDGDDTRTRFQVTFQDKSLKSRHTLTVSDHECIILATGNSFQGRKLIESLGHEYVAPMRSMFGFLLPQSQPVENINRHVLGDLTKSNNDIIAPLCRITFKHKVSGRKRPRVFKAFGPVQFGITGSGLKGHYVAGRASLKVSSNAAKELKECEFKGTLFVHFCPEIGQVEEIYEKLWEYRQEKPNEQLTKKCPIKYRETDYDNYDFETGDFAVYVADCVPPEIWGALCRIVDKGVSMNNNVTWGNLSPKKVRSLADMIVACPFKFNGRYLSKTRGSFVNAGGLVLKELEMTTLASKLISGIFCCGMLLNVDGTSIGYNRMIDWATGYTAGVHAANYIFNKSHKSRQLEGIN